MLSSNKFCFNPMISGLLEIAQKNVVARKCCGGSCIGGNCKATPENPFANNSENVVARKCCGGSCIGGNCKATPENPFK